MMIEVSRPPEYARTTFSGMCAPVGEAADPASQEDEKDRFLYVQPVLGLVENYRPRRIDDGVSDFIAAMRRETVHEHGMFGCAREKPLVHLERPKDRLTTLTLVLLPHAGPNVGVDGVNAFD